MRFVSALLLVAPAIAGCLSPSVRDAAGPVEPATVAADPPARAREVDPPEAPAARADADPAPDTDEGTYADAPLTAYVNGVLGRVSAQAGRPEVRFRARVLDLPEVNAHAHSEGRIDVARGLLALMGSEAELAVVLGHEVAHVVRRHGHVACEGDEVMVRADPVSTRQKWDCELDHELQADRLGIAFALRAGYDPRAGARILAASQLADDADGSRNPSMTPRLARLPLYTRDMAGGELGRDAYLDHVDGLAFGDRAKGPLARIRVRRVDKAGSFTGVAARVCGPYPVNDLALLNGVEASVHVEAGRRIKCVEP